MAWIATLCYIVQLMTTGRIILYLAILVFGLAECGGFADAADFHRLATVPALAVSATNNHVGDIHYIIVQLDEDGAGQGPMIAFSEQFRGSTVGEEWKAGVRAAVAAAGRITGADTRNWSVTVRNRSHHSYTEGASASAAIAVALIAAQLGESLNQDVAMSASVSPEGRLLEVDGLPAKLDGAARGNMRVLLIPKGQGKTEEWDLLEQAKQRNVTVIEVGTLQEAYDLMVHRRR